MDTSLENITNDPEKEKPNSERIKRGRLAKMGNPAWGVTWRVLLVCAMIDLPFWAYFHFVKGVSLWEGLAQLRSEVQAKINPPKATEDIRFKMADVQQGQPKPKPT